MDIVTTSNFHATLLQGKVSVVFVPAEHLRRTSWPLLNFDESGCQCADANHICRSVQAETFSIVSDHDGVTLFMDPNGIEMFQAEGLADAITVAPQEWRAIQIHLGPMAAEFPGVISFLSKLLADDNISILNMSTYDTDIIYVQESSLDDAIACLQSKLSRGIHGLIEAKQSERSHSQDELLPAETAEDDIDGTSTRKNRSASVIEAGQYLVVNPDALVLVRLRKECVRDCAYGLTRLMLLSTSKSGQPTSAEEVTSESSKAPFWCYCETAEEISLIMTERHLDDFPEDAIMVSPDRWRAIQLCGRTYGFDETGVVAAMSSFDTETQVLNISSFGSNVAFVLDCALEESLAVLCESLALSLESVHRQSNTWPRA